jgi:type VI protein secretion system component Hcp
VPAHQPKPEPPARKEAVTAPAERMLALQRQIGNRAVGALLARTPKTKAPAKMPAPKPPQLKDGIYAVVPGMGTIQLQSAQLGASRQITSASGQGANREAAAPAISEISVTSEQGDHSTQLFRAALEGNLGTVEIRFVKAGKPYMTIKLHNALVSSFSISGHGGDTQGKPLESWTLNGDKIEYETAKAAPETPPG